MGAATDADDYKCRSAELRRVAHGLNDIALGVNGVTPTEAILTNCNDLAPLEEDRNVIASHMLGRITPALREHITVDVLLDPRGEQMRIIDTRIECGHPVGSLRRDVLRHVAP